MTALDLLADLRTRGVALSAIGDRLAYDAPAGVVTPGVVALLKTHKAGLLAMLTPIPPRPDPPTPTLADGWFRVGAAAPRREYFAYDSETKTHPGWWDYLYELHNRRLAVVNGKVVKEM